MFCTYTGPNSGALNKHIKNTHGRRKWIEFKLTVIPHVQPYQCPNCQWCFRRKHNHKCAKLQNIVLTEYKPKVKKSKGSLPKEEASVSVSCSICKSKFGRVSAYLQHISRHSLSEEVDIRRKATSVLTTKCIDCNLYFTRKTFYPSKHKCQNFQEFGQDPEDDSSEEDENQPIPARQFTSSSEVPSFPCPVCKREYKSRDQFRHHYTKKHKTALERIVVRGRFIHGVQEEQCPKCLLYFWSRSSKHHCDKYSAVLKGMALLCSLVTLVSQFCIRW